MTVRRDLDPQDHPPAYGALARRWGRFERDLALWLQTPEGLFAQWTARQALIDDPALGEPAR
jgi:hypothetical protein